MSWKMNVPSPLVGENTPPNYRQVKRQFCGNCKHHCKQWDFGEKSYNCAIYEIWTFLPDQYICDDWRDTA